VVDNNDGDAEALGFEKSTKPRNRIGNQTYNLAIVRLRTVGAAMDRVKEDLKITDHIATSRILFIAIYFCHHQSHRSAQHRGSRLSIEGEG